MQKRQSNLSYSEGAPLPLGAGAQKQALYRALRAQIESGALPAGSKLPPTRKLASEHGMSRGAIVAAFELLIADGFAVARQGAGTYVADHVPQMPDAPEPEPRAQAREVRPQPGDLGIAMPDQKTLDRLRTLISRSLARPSDALFYYPDGSADLDLRQAIAIYLRTARGVKCSAEDIIITTGMMQGLDLFLRAAIRPGDPIWIEDPGYLRARYALEAAGADLVPIPVDDEGLDVAAGRRRNAHARAVYVTPSHQFPMGISMSMKRRLDLVEWAQENDAWIIEDDYDSEFRFGGAPLTSLQGVDASGRVLYLGTFSKILFPGLRVGYAVAPPELREKMSNIRALSDRFPSGLIAPGLTEFLNEGGFSAHILRARKRAKRARDSLLSALSENGVPVAHHDQGLHVLCPLDDGFDDARVSARANELGAGCRPLSEHALQCATPPALVVGFSGFTDAELGSAARAIAQAVAEEKTAQRR